MKYTDFVEAFLELDTSEQRQFISDYLDYANIKDILEYLERIGYDVS